ncbi:MAG: IS21-like element helper ATPase IstB [Deltaproteobacteria bacterium]|nr:IS21-like element helper ATPase IstB [Deltaproteobacteria bacterium]MBW2228430.1 IS21-like element helper ATPase IstB [Deltaproteobacteria bacterium]MBW2327992.1 IS21-like element helper ATPase IstB [Deltaproteobacteria bacterium]
MLTHPIFEKLGQLRFYGMLKALEEQMQMPDIKQLGFEERLGLLVDREMTERENRRLKTRLRKAKLRQNACVEDVNFRHPRKLDKTLFMNLADGRWLKEHNNVLLIGPTGVGKTYLACALAQKACRLGYSVLYFRLPRLLHELSIAKADGRYDKLLTGIGRIDLLVLDDWGLYKFVKEQRHDLLEILEDRHGRRSTLVTSQLPVKHWHEIIADPTLADAILDRLVHNAYKLVLAGESMRKKQSKLT